MELKSACKSILDQLGSLISQLTDEEFTETIELLNYATIGQHVRHTLEFFICLMEGSKSSVVNYDNRKRDHSIEHHKVVAMSKISEILAFVENMEENAPVQLEASYSLESSVPISIKSNYNRELAYNIEHAVHHMAIIKIGLKHLCPSLDIPKNFGVAVSTIRHIGSN